MQLHSIVQLWNNADYIKSCSHYRGGGGGGSIHSDGVNYITCFCSSLFPPHAFTWWWAGYREQGMNEFWVGGGKKSVCTRWEAYCSYMRLFSLLVNQLIVIQSVPVVPNLFVYLWPFITGHGLCATMSCQEFKQKFFFFLRIYQDLKRTQTSQVQLRLAVLCYVSPLISLPASCLSSAVLSNEGKKCSKNLKIIHKNMYNCLLSFWSSCDASGFSWNQSSSTRQ